MTEEKFSPEQSIRVIQSMIEKTKKNFSENAFYLILWGWLILLASLGHYVLLVVAKYPKHYLVWNIMWIGAIATIIYSIRTERKARVKTYMSEATKYFGIATGITFTILGFIVGIYEMWTFAFPFYFLLYGFVSFVSGVIIGFIPLRWAGAVCWVIAIVSVFAKFDLQLLLMALAVLAAFIIPGHLLHARHKKQIS